MIDVPVVYGKLFRSPLRDDKNPTCSFYDTDSGLKMIDYSGDFHGDCFDAVQRLYNCNYNAALMQVCMKFGLLEGESMTPVPPSRSPKRTPNPRTEKIFQIKRREWTLGDKKFWTQFKITRKDLSHFNVRAVDVLWINGEVRYQYHHSDPAYAYYFGNGKYKIYFPFRKKYRFLGNGANIQGWDQLDKSQPKIIITKSLKDVIVLRKMGFNAISPPGEGALIDPNVINKLKDKDITLLFDNDKPGIKWAKANSFEYQIPYMYLKIEHGAKDTSDLVKLVGLEEAKLILQRHLKQRKLCQRQKES